MRERRARHGFLRPALLLGLGLFTVSTFSALGGALPRLPKDRPLPQGPDSPGVVTFRHATHVDAARPDCTTCHSSLFPILRRTSATSAATAASAAPTAQAASPTRHAEMEAGKSCGRCHDGKAAHGLDECGTCHEPAK